ncbi:MAG: hypothetical protein ACXAEN_02910 [Candidatus Thorarchaeota archaeon]|jgi:hypothetical protein
MTGNCSPIPTEFESIITDSIDWLCPKPKARILYDLSHYAHFGVDPWDDTLFSTIYSEMRNSLVNRSYTFDKLHGSPSGNLTAQNLAPYDVLILCESANDFTSSEISVVTNWVSQGGSLLVFNDAAFQPNDQKYMNNITLPFGMWLNDTYSGGDQLLSFTSLHPIGEGVSGVQMYTVGGINRTGSSYVVLDDGSGNVMVAANEFGSGRVLLLADRRFLTDLYIVNSENSQFSVNAMNWLSSADATVLVYVRNLHASLVNPYAAPVVEAINDLGLSFHLTFEDVYLNLSLYRQTWDLVIMDADWPFGAGYLDDLSWYLDIGGKVIFSYHMVHSIPSNPMWSKIGFGYAANMPNFVPIHIWDAGHGIFNIPNDYGALNFTPTIDYGDEGDLLIVFSNATALAGYNQTEMAGNATIVLGFGGQVLYNGYLIDQFYGDIDDSTYADNFELWENEIAYMLRPTIGAPSDVVVELGSTGESITWNPTSDRPFEFTITRDSVEIASTSWDGGPITVLLDGYAVGTYDFVVTVFDTAGQYASDSATANVEDTTPPEWIIGPSDQVLNHTERLGVQFSASDLSGVDGWWLNDTEHFAINSSGFLEDTFELPVGNYGLDVFVNDTFNNTRNHQIRIRILYVEPPVTTTPTTTTTTGTTTPTTTTTPPPGGFDTTMLIIIGAAGGVIVIIIIIMMKRRGGE